MSFNVSVLWRVAFRHPSDTHQLGSNKQPLKAAAEATRKKTSKHDAEVAKAGPQGLPTPFKFQSLAFETTGAMGRETEKWWKSVVAMEAELRGAGQPSSRRALARAHLGSQLVLLVLETIHSDDTREISSRGDRVMHQAKLWLSSREHR